MRNSLRCPKCSHNEILFVPQLRDTDFDVLTVDAHIKSAWTGERIRFGQLQAFICLGCGFTEIYTMDPRNIPLDRIPGARILVGEPSAPYR